MLRYANGARGALWVSQVAPGEEIELRLRIYGTKGRVNWLQSNPNRMIWTPLGKSARIVTRGANSGETAAPVTRVPPGHPKGYLEGFATIYSEVALAIKAARTGKKPPNGVMFPTIDDGMKSLYRVYDGFAQIAVIARWSTRWVNTTLQCLSKSGKSGLQLKARPPRKMPMRCRDQPLISGAPSRHDTTRQATASGKVGYSSSRSCYYLRRPIPRSFKEQR